MTTSAAVLTAWEQRILAAPPPGFSAAFVRRYFDEHRAHLLALLAPLDATHDQADQQEPLFHVTAKRALQPLIPSVQRVLEEAERAFAAAGFPLRGKGTIEAQVVESDRKSEYKQGTKKVYIGTVHARTIETAQRHAAYHELAHWYHDRHLGFENITIKDQFERVKRERVTGGCVADRAFDEYKALVAEAKRIRASRDVRVFRVAPDQAIKAARERYIAAAQGLIPNRRYEDLRSRWIPTEYARKNHHEWFAELLTTRVLFPEVLAPEVKAWLDAAAKPHQGGGDTWALFQVDGGCRRAGVCVLAKLWDADGEEVWLATTQPVETRASIARADALLWQGERKSPGVLALLARLATEERSAAPNTTVLRLLRPIKRGELWYFACLWDLVDFPRRLAGEFAKATARVRQAWPRSRDETLAVVAAAERLLNLPAETPVLYRKEWRNFYGQVIKVKDEPAVFLELADSDALLRQRSGRVIQYPFTLVRPAV